MVIIPLPRYYADREPDYITNPNVPAGKWVEAIGGKHYMVLCDFFMLLGHYKRHCEAEMEAKPRRGGNDNYASTRYEQQLASFTLIHAIEVQLNVLGLASHEAQALLVSLPQFDAASANYIKKVAMVDAKAKKRSRKRFGEVHNYNGGLDFEDIALLFIISQIKP